MPRIGKKRYVRKRPYIRRSRMMNKRKHKVMYNIAKQVLAKESENKMVKQNAKYFITNDPNSVTWASTNVRDCCGPIRAITQGTGTGNRIGAKIKLKKFMYTYTIYPNTNLDHSYPLLVKMWIVSDKFGLNNASTQNIADACKTASTGIGNFLEDGNTTTGLKRNIEDIFNPVNAERFKVYTTRTHKIACSSAPNFSGSTWAYGNNDFKLFVKRRINLLKYVPKQFRYQDSLTNVQFSKRIFVVWQVVLADGSVFDDNFAQIADGYDIQFEDN